MNTINIQDILSMYDNNESTYTIAEKYNTYPNKIRRLLIKYGRQLNDRSTAQKTAIKTGRSKHPTLGQKRSEDVKQRISEKVYQNWQKISEEEHQKRVDKSKELWYNMSEEERESLHKAAANAVRQAAKDGSQMEQFLYQELIKHKYNPLFHMKELISNNTMEIDIFVPALNVAIEIDGPAHFFPIWGEENLQKHIKTDAHKSGLLLNCGFVVVRIKHLTKSLSQKHKRTVLNHLFDILESVKQKFPEVGDRYIELEVK